MTLQALNLDVSCDIVIYLIHQSKRENIFIWKSEFISSPNPFWKIVKIDDTAAHHSVLQ